MKLDNLKSELTEKEKELVEMIRLRNKDWDSFTEEETNYWNSHKGEQYLLGEISILKKGISACEEETKILADKYMEEIHELDNTWRKVNKQALSNRNKEELEFLKNLQLVNCLRTGCDNIGFIIHNRMEQLTTSEDEE